MHDFPHLYLVIYLRRTRYLHPDKPRLGNVVQERHLLIHLMFALCWELFWLVECFQRQIHKSARLGLTVAADLQPSRVVFSRASLSLCSTISAVVILSRDISPSHELHFLSCWAYWDFTFADLLGKTVFMYLSTMSANVCLLASAWLKYFPSLIKDSVY